MQDPASELLRIPLFPRRWVNRRYDARSVDDPRYTDTVREDFDRIADLSEAERVGPEAGHGASSSGVTLKLKTSSITPRSRSVARNAALAPLKTTSARPDSRLSSSTAAAPSPRERRCLTGARTSSAVHSRRPRSTDFRLKSSIPAR